jgi:Kef-type K+ transport system membrane component KefB
MNHITANAAQIFLSLTVILIACKACGFIIKRLGQPPVIGEMVAGVLLGPSLLGAVAPNLAHGIFPPDSRPILYAIAQIGLTLYMFVVGIEFRSDLLKNNLRTAAGVSIAGILVPFALGSILACWFLKLGGFFVSSTPLSMAMLFIGAAMSITAFPMLARIILEHGLTGTRAGTIALAAGSLDDAIAWILLAGVLGGISGKPILFIAALGGGIFYTLICMLVVRPLLHRVNSVWKDEVGMLGLIAVLLCIGGWFTDTIGLYSVFGAFILGLAIPRGSLAEKTAERIGPLTTALLLPVFFTYSGLNTKIGLLNSPMLWLICGVIILAAIAGKLLACYAAGRFSGESHRDSLTIATLMNARGLMELILLNIGFQAGLITQTLFTMFVLMAVVTTLMAAPGFNAAKRLGANNY